MADIRQTPEWAKYVSNMGWKVEKVGKNYVHIKKLPIFGSYIKIPRPTWPLDLHKIDQIARQNHALLVKINPKIKADSADAKKIHNQLVEHGYIKEYWTMTVTRTSIIDLSKSQESLLNSFHKKTRQYINLAKRNGIKIIQSDNINLAYKLYRQSALRNNFTTQSHKDINTRFQTFHTAKMALLLIAQSKANKEVASLLILLNPKNKEAEANLAGMSEEGGKSRASYLLYFEAILLCKKLGVKKFDFGGIADERYRIAKIMQGATFFKRGFRGQKVPYLGSYIKFYISPLVNIMKIVLPKI